MDGKSTIGSISEARRRLVRLMQQLNFGRIEGLPVRAGEPVLDPPPRIVREIKFGADSAPRPETGVGDFALKAQVIELLERVESIGDGVIELLEIKHGLPFRMLVRE